MKLETVNVLMIEHKILDDLILPDVPDEWAIKTVEYINGVHTMATEVIKAIKDLGGK